MLATGAAKARPRGLGLQVAPCLWAARPPCPGRSAVCCFYGNFRAKRRVPVHSLPCMGSWPWEGGPLNCLGLAMMAGAPGPHRLSRQLVVRWHLWVTPPPTSWVPVISALCFMLTLGYRVPRRHLAKSGRSPGSRDTTAPWAELDSCQTGLRPCPECFLQKKMR